MITTLASDAWPWDFIFSHPSIIGVIGVLIVVLAFFEGRVVHGKVAGGITLFIGLIFAIFGFGGLNPISMLGAILFSWGISQQPIGFSGGVLIVLGLVLLSSAWQGDNGLNRTAFKSETCTPHHSESHSVGTSLLPSRHSSNDTTLGISFQTSGGA